ncbi:hypothetical protein FACS18948_2960 [Clostridia bacterium]|nr:hypothetical protein FACS18948_2960 [Clostridia bacterium]
MKPFAIGRNNWLFFDTPDGADASQVIYSILLTAIDNGLRPYEYIEYLLESLPSAKASEIDDYLPWSDKLPVGIRATDPFDTSAIGIAGSSAIAIQGGR